MYNDGMKRIPLPSGYVLDLNHPYRIASFLGSGSSCLVYEAEFVNAAGVFQKVIIRELYPNTLKLNRIVKKNSLEDQNCNGQSSCTQNKNRRNCGSQNNNCRNGDGQNYDRSNGNDQYDRPTSQKTCHPIQAEGNQDQVCGTIMPESEKERLLFEKQKERFIHTYGMMTQFSQEILPFQGVWPIDLFLLNNTIYLVLNWQNSKPLDQWKAKEISEIFAMFVSAAQIVQKIHQAGCLLLDLKPENLLVIQEFQALCLIDFDSIIPCKNSKSFPDQQSIRITPDFAPPNLQRKHLSQAADVYSLGALLFWMLFGRTPMAKDREYGASWDFSLLEWSLELYNPLLVQKLSAFFTNTLASLGSQRWQSADKVCQAAGELCRLSDLSKPYVRFSRIENPYAFAGREQECQKLQKGLDTYAIFCLSGMAGIGKTSLAKNVLKERQNVLWLYWNNSLLETLADDLQFSIHTIHPITGKKQESLEDYVKRKLKILKELLPKALLVFDNVPEQTTIDFSMLVKAGFSILLISRSAMEGMPGLRLESISEMEVWKQVYRKKTGRIPDENAQIFLEKIGQKTGCHTLLMSLLCGLSAYQKGILTSIWHLLQNMPDQSEPSASLFHNGIQISDKLSVCLQTLLLDSLSISQRQLLAFLSIYKIPIDLEALHILYPYSYTDLHALIQQGWMSDLVHPLISELCRLQPERKMLEELSASLCECMKPTGQPYAIHLETTFEKGIVMPKILSIAQQLLPNLDPSVRGGLLCGLFYIEPFYHASFFETWQNELDQLTEEPRIWYYALDHSIHYNLLCKKRKEAEQRIDFLHKRLPKVWIQKLQMDVIEDEMEEISIALLHDEQRPTGSKPALNRKALLKRLDQLEKQQLHLAYCAWKQMPKGTVEKEGTLLDLVILWEQSGKIRKIKPWMLEKPKDPTRVPAWALLLARLDPDFSDEALKICLDSLDLFMPMDQIDAIWLPLSSMFNDLNDPEQALFYLKKALAIAEENEEIPVWYLYAKEIRDYIQIQENDMAKHEDLPSEVE